MFVVFTAFWLGILTSISPCPLATNIASVTFISKKIAHPKFVIISGLFYSIGRMLAYSVVGFIVIKSFMGVPAIANLLQKYMNMALGPILILIGIFLIDVIKLNIKGFSISKDKFEKLSNSGALGSFVLGFIFALSFCPVSAALFFGSLIPLSLSSNIGAVLPFVYGFATGLPVLAFAVLTALGVKAVSSWINKASKLELYARRITGAVFIIVGIYYVAIIFS
ncbi:MAG: aromatic aminobenezylarsenical efflux permease ArsG family transporter [Proteobacteria bacterium]|nr:aromatic aminobenezylarsenical efflux permease ArsG family transporter [Pseudomonadota bacterium]